VHEWLMRRLRLNDALLRASRLALGPLGDRPPRLWLSRFGWTLANAGPPARGLSIEPVEARGRPAGWTHGDARGEECRRHPSGSGGRVDTFVSSSSTCQVAVIMIVR
jgi:hypothetical protein